MQNEFVRFGTGEIATELGTLEEVSDDVLGEHRYSSSHRLLADRFLLRVHDTAWYHDFSFRDLFYGNGFYESGFWRRGFCRSGR